MTKEELIEIKAASVLIHAAAVKAGKWENKPEWESKLMDIVCDISRAVEAEKGERHGDRGSGHAELDEFHKQREIWANIVRTNNAGGGDLTEDEGYSADYDYWIGDTVEDCLADAVIDILDAVEGYVPDWHERESRVYPAKVIYNNGRETLTQLAFEMVRGIMDRYPPRYSSLLHALSLMREWCTSNGIDLRRFVELRMKYLGVVPDKKTEK